MQARGGVFKAVDPKVASNLLDGVAAVLEVASKLSNIPVFGACAESLRAVYTVAKDFKDNKELVVRLASRCSLLVKAIADRMLAENRSLREPLRGHAIKFTEFLEEVAHFLETVKGKPKWYRVLNSSGTRKELEEYDNRLHTMVDDFQLAAVLNIDKWATENDADRNAAENTAQEALEQLLKNDTTVLAKLELTHAQGGQMMEILRTIQATLNIGSLTPTERDLLTKARKSISRVSKLDLDEDHWYIVESAIVREPSPFASGGFGEVYRGTWGGTRKVAVKCLVVKHPDEKLKALLRSEVERWSRLRHPNILQLFGANLQATPPFMVSPYMRNGNLLAYLTAYPHADRVELAFDIACAMEYLHGRGILHCDLKAVNVLVDDLGNALVADFGFATVATRVSILSKVARPGTRRWMAPELFARRPRLSEKSDVYAFAMTVYEMYTLQVPFCDVLEDAVVPIVEKGERPDLDEYEDLDGIPENERIAIVTMPEPIKDLVKRCWDSVTEGRPTFATIIADLKKAYPHLSGPQIPSRLPSASARADSGVVLSSSTSRYAWSLPGSFPDQDIEDGGTLSAQERANIERETEARVVAQLEARDRERGKAEFELRERARVEYEEKMQEAEAKRRKAEEDARQLKAMLAEQQRPQALVEERARRVRTPRQLTAQEKMLPNELQDVLLLLYNGPPQELDLS
ncbi:hypothetical protein HDU93_004790, partial [Gonapodya sp. JEL0774]